MKRIAWLILLACSPAFATTWYIRTDGGTATQCTGTTNAAYPGTGTAQACAFNHPFWLLNQSTFAWNIAAGDTVQFEDVGPYYMGQRNTTTGRGSTWAFCNGNVPNCVMPPFPDNVKFYGVGVGSCHQSDATMPGPSALTSTWAGHGALKNATKLLGINGAFYVLDLQGSTGVDVECFDISQPTQCTLLGNTYTHCSNNSGAGNGDDYATHGIFLEYQTAQGPSNATLKDIEIHGIANEGMSGGHLNASGTDTFTASDIYLMGNGGAGWDWDGGGCGTSCESLGTMNFNWIRIEWNGCVEVQPNGGTVGGNGYTECADDSNGGYGDGWALIATQGNWTINHGLFRWNTQDGFDSLHTSDDLAHPPTAITLENSWSEGNEGQTFKLGFSPATTARSNVSIGNCRRLASAFPPNPAGYNTDLSDFCRAGGDQWALIMNNGMGPMKIQANTSVGYGATMYDIECAGTCTTTTQLLFQDNVSMGYLDPVTGVYAGGLYLGTADPFANAGSVISYNDWYSMKNNTCPQDAAETNYICTNPNLVSETIDAINPYLLASSPALSAGTAVSGLTTYYDGSTRGNPPDIGALPLLSGAQPASAAGWWSF